MLEELLQKNIKIEKDNGKTNEEINDMINAGLGKLATIQTIKGEQIITITK